MVPWRIDGIGSREIDDQVDLFSRNLEAATKEEAEERARRMFESIQGKPITVETVRGYDRDRDESVDAPIDAGPYVVIPYEISGMFYKEVNGGGWYDFNIDCEYPDDSPLHKLGIQSVWIEAPSILVLGDE